MDRAINKICCDDESATGRDWDVRTYKKLRVRYKTNENQWELMRWERGFGVFAITLQ